MEEITLIPWQTNVQMCEVLDTKERRLGLIRLLSNEKLAKCRAAAVFIGKCVSGEFRNYVHPYK